VLGDGAAAAAWLESQPGVGGAVEALAGGVVAFAFDGDHENQATLLAGLVAAGVRVRAFEERVSSFEDILVEVAEEARRSGSA
jgi:hypothetical protein